MNPPTIYKPADLVLATFSRSDMVLVPLFYIWVFFVKIPKKGLNDNNNIKTYGFLYERFLPECYYWELIELGRKFAFVMITKVGQRMSMTEAL